MSIITNKMKTARDANRTSACKYWQACDEGSGTTLTDKIGGVVETVGNVPTHDVAHAGDYGKDVGPVTSGSLPTIKTQCIFVVMAIVRTVSNFFTFKLGSGPAIFINNSRVELASLSETVKTAASAGGVVDQTMMSALVLKGNTLYHYRSINGASVAEVNSVDATAFRSLNPVISVNDSTVICSGSVVQDVFGYALFDYTEDEMPSLAVIEAALTEIEANWKIGHKFLPESLL